MILNIKTWKYHFDFRILIYDIRIDTVFHVITVKNLLWHSERFRISRSHCQNSLLEHTFEYQNAIPIFAFRFSIFWLSLFYDKMVKQPTKWVLILKTWYSVTFQTPRRVSKWYFDIQNRALKVSSDIENLIFGNVSDAKVASDHKNMKNGYIRISKLNIENQNCIKKNWKKVPFGKFTISLLVNIFKM